MVDCLCNFARGAGHTRTGSIQILDLDNPQTFKRLILRCAQDMTRVGDGVALAKFLAQGANDGIPHKLLTLLPTTRSAEEIGLGSLQQQHGLFCTYVSRESSFATEVGIAPAEPDDFALAIQHADQIYREVGRSYAYAVQRCLRREFPGPDSKKSFGFENFRKDFFDNAVAPVQANYDAAQLEG
ncbi:hypothetical protein SAPIO_CDS6395 [Scedosporium apiospermum]|uniref:Uncharacterized protein n=1 Tax=Pseudallescheria apiosperma TaxID=563466 RepID=A0A084G3U1_PSEDA|nr:uncharacterized protein SAPIO_CDS6395 [Scedosporium apiospermum]KEZ42003.1 hypothetical protein SAPIO_CDS6395 [Scedosporium apiospermum]